MVSSESQERERERGEGGGERGIALFLVPFRVSNRNDKCETLNEQHGLAEINAYSAFV